MNFTTVAPVKLAPLMITLAPTDPLVGVNPMTRGATAKLLELVAVPAAFVAVMGPVVAPVGTAAVIWLLVLVVELADVPLNFTAVVPVKFVPVMITLIPTPPLVGVKPVMVGRNMTVKLVALLAVPAAVIMVMSPVLAPAGTIVVIVVAVFTVKAADVPLNVTAVAPVKLAPLIVTLVPIGPLVGETLVILGATTKFGELVAVPAPVVTLIGPVVALDGTSAVICELEST